MLCPTGPEPASAQLAEVHPAAPLKRNVRVVAEGVGGTAAHGVAAIVFAFLGALTFVGVGKIAPGLRHASLLSRHALGDLFMTKRATSDLL